MERVDIRRKLTSMLADYKYQIKKLKSSTKSPIVKSAMANDYQERIVALKAAKDLLRGD
jgi:hypothetical protein